MVVPNVEVAYRLCTLLNFIAVDSPKSWHRANHEKAWIEDKFKITNCCFLIFTPHSNDVGAIN